MSYDPKKLPRVHTYLDIIGVFLGHVPIKDVPVPKAKQKTETWEHFRADAKQALDIVSCILSPLPRKYAGYEFCKGKIIERFVRVSRYPKPPLRKK